MRSESLLVATINQFIKRTEAFSFCSSFGVTVNLTYPYNAENTLHFKVLTKDFIQFSALVHTRRGKM
ncbi:MAG: hypothetical protein ACI9YH_001638 [Colwellia sp.]|jgi:hypothetical protein